MEKPFVNKALGHAFAGICDAEVRLAIVGDAGGDIRRVCNTRGFGNRSGTSTADVDRLLEVLPRLLSRVETRSSAG